MVKMPLASPHFPGPGLPLASRGEAWQGMGMTTPSRNSSTGAGAIIALLAMTGVIGGGFMGQPSAGLLAGMGAGILIALLLWLRERRR